MVQRQDGATRFALIQTNGDHSDAVKKAHEALNAHGLELLHERVDVRSDFWSTYKPSDTKDGMLSLALESMIGNLRAPVGKVPFRWTSSPGQEGELFRLNEIFGMVSAWVHIDPDVAADLMKATLSCQKTDGFVPATFDPLRQSSGTQAAWPLLVQASELVWNETKDLDFIQFIVPKLHRYIIRSLKHFDPNRDGIHCWQSANEAFIPETFDRRLASADISTLLLCEIEAYQRLALHHPSYSIDQTDLEEELSRLKENLLHVLWDTETSSFRDRYIGGRRITRLTLSCFTPLLWPNLPTTQADSIRQLITAPRGYTTEIGIPLWQKWESDAEIPPVPATHQFLFFRSITSSRDNRRWGFSFHIDLEYVAT